MSWSKTDPMQQREQLIVNYATGLYSVSELAERYGVSRKTVYKWIARYQSDGLAGLHDHNRAPLSCPHRTDPTIEDRLLAFRAKHPHWGPRTIHAYLRQHEPELKIPAPSTIGDLFDRHGLSSKRTTRRRYAQPDRRAPIVTAANTLWCCDFKGEFRLGNQQYCYPLTITDNFSRMILGCRGQAETTYQTTRRNFERVFSEYGLPENIRSDNGAPFAGQGPRRISRLSLWWLKLGIRHVLSRPGCPQDNPQHERMHRRLKDETTRPPGGNDRAQQRLFNRFVTEYNTERPHQGIAMQTPSMLYQPSMRQLPKNLREPDYPGHYERRQVSNGGMMYFKAQRIFVSEVLIGETVGLEETGDGLWSIYTYELLLGRFSQQDWRLR